MNNLAKLALATLLAGSATIAAAQTSSFADRLAVMQSYSGSGSVWHPAPKTFSVTSQDPARRLTESRMQSLSDAHSATYAPSKFDLRPAGGPTFAKENPKGLPFAYYQSASNAKWTPAGARAPA